MTIKQSKLSVILPCYNPRDEWAANIITNYNYISSFVQEFEMIIVNDGSVNNFDLITMSKYFKEFEGIKLISYNINKGKGFALRRGVSESSGDIVMYTDIDFPYTNDSFKHVYEALLSGQYNVVTGTRGDEYYKSLPAARVRVSRFLRFLIRSFLGIPVDDTQCGLKGFDANGKRIFLETSINRFLFDLEFIFLSARKNLSIKPVNVKLNEGIELSVMPWKTLLHESRNFLKIFFKALF